MANPGETAVNPEAPLICIEQWCIIHIVRSHIVDSRLLGEACGRQYEMDLGGLDFSIEASVDVENLCYPGTSCPESGFANVSPIILLHPALAFGWIGCKIEYDAMFARNEDTTNWLGGP